MKDSATPLAKWKDQHQDMGSMASAFTSDQGFASVLSSLTNQLATHLGSIDKTLEEAMKNQSAGNSTNEENAAQN